MQLMTKNPERRLGCVPGIGEVAINKHPFFAFIDWSKLEARQVRPPFQPKIVSRVLYSIFHRNILGKSHGCLYKAPEMEERSKQKTNRLS